LDQESFYRLLAWLDPDRDLAATKFEAIRSRAIKILIFRGCYEEEDIWDETVDRVARKLPGIEEDYVGDPGRYFYGVAKMVCRERRHKPSTPVPIPDPDPTEPKELYDRCLTTCLDRLDERERKLILEYFKETGRAKIDTHNAMAEKLGSNIKALRTRAHRIKKTLKLCVLECIERNEDAAICGYI